MNRLLLPIIIIFVPFFIFSQQKKDTIDCNYLQTPILEFIADIEEQTDLSFTYTQLMIKDLTITVNGDQMGVFDVLDKAFKYTPLRYIYYKPNLIFIVNKANFIDQLPVYTLSSNDFESEDDSQLSTVMQKYIKGRNPNIKKTIIVGDKNNVSNGKQVKIIAKLFDEETNEPLIGATIFIKENGIGAATNNAGELTLRLPQGKFSAEIRCVGMQDAECILDIQSEGAFSYVMPQEVKSISEVTINAQQDYKIRGSEAGLDKLSIKSVKELPSLMGEKDIIKISQLLPGIVSVSEGSSGVNVRGGNADQNLFYINKLPLYSSSHLFGFFSSINSSIIENFAIYKGHVPAQYGGRLSSVFTIDTRKGNKEKIFAQGGISPISANLELEGPVIKDKASFVVSARSSYSDWILKRLPNENLKNSSVFFYDIAASIDFDINEKSNASGFFYNSNDFFNLNSKNEYQYDNLGGGVYYTYRLSNRLKSSSHFVQSNYSFSTVDNNNEVEAFSHNYSIKHTEIKSQLSYIFTEKQNLNFGGSFINYNIDRGKIEPYGSNSRRNELDLGGEKGFESALFFEDKYELTKKIKISAGLRYSFFQYRGPQDVYIYGQELGVSEDNIIDTLSFKKGEAIKNYNGPEFRMGADFKTGDFSSLKFSFVQMRQYLYLLSNTYSITPTDQWKLSDYYSKPAKSMQASVGYYKTFASMGMSASSEVYYKQSDNITEFKDGADFLNSKLVETQTLQGNQDAYGFEFMLAKDEGRLNGWVTYTYSKSFVQVDGINNDKKYSSNFDKPHVVNLTGNYKFSRRFILSANVMYSTGRPITMPQSIYYLQDMPFVNYSDRNEFRVPDYFRTDLSLTIEGNLKAKKLFHSYWMINVYNVTGRKNPYSIYFQSEQGKIKGYKYSVIGAPIFTISWNFKLGNYANE
ncbi:MAG: TonB-dependent receptor [Salinivirgaceae bacterium]|nr:TonB-dependent receptor [Salinivirgaceae bacterium]